jgi:hypothetical protein
MDDELEQNDDDDSVALSYDSDREKLLCEWWSRWKEVSGASDGDDDDGDNDDDLINANVEQWQATHTKEIVTLPNHPWRGTKDRAIYIEPNPGTMFETDDPTWKRFAQFSDRLLLKLKRGIGQHVGTPLPEIEKVQLTYLLDGIITTTDTCLVYGGEKEGKSTWAHKLCICIASGKLDFDGRAIKHGRVLYVTLDPGARKGQVAVRMEAICKRLGIEQPDNLVVVHETVFLDDPLSVESLLRYNPGPFVLVVIDPLYRALTGGDPSNPKAINEAIESVIRIREATGAAVMILNHDTKAGGMYGSKFLGAAADCKIFIERNFKTNKVTLKVEQSKNTAAMELPPIHYQLENEYLAPVGGDSTKRRDDKPASVHRPDMLALIPITTEWKSISEVRELIEHLFKAPPGKGRDKEWERTRAAWELAGLIEQRSRRMRRLK